MAVRSNLSVKPAKGEKMDNRIKCPRCNGLMQAVGMWTPVDYKDMALLTQTVYEHLSPDVRLHCGIVRINIE